MILKILSIFPAKFQKKYFYLSFAGEKAVKVHEQTLAAHPELKENAEISKDFLDEILQQDQRWRAIEYSYLLLSYSPRSQKALTEKLARKGFLHDAQTFAVQHLKELNLLDDNTLAKNVIESKLKSSNPVGLRKVQLDLSRKGLDRQTIEEATQEIKEESGSDILDEDERAYIALSKRSRQIKQIDARTFQRRLFEYLVRRGFSFDSANKALSRFKREQKIVEDEQDFYQEDTIS